MTLSPTCNSDIIADFPFSRETVAVEGKHPPPDGGGGGGAVVVVVVGGGVVVLGTPSQQWKVSPHLAKQRSGHRRAS